MRETIGALAMVAALLAVPTVGLATSGAGGSAVPQANNASDVAPGEQMSGVVGVQGAEMSGEVQERAAGLAIANAGTDNATADVVADQLTRIEERLAALEERKAALAQARENGSLSEGRYRAEVAELAAQTSSLERLANQTGNATAGLPADLLAAKGINVAAIQSLQTRAANLTGPEVAEIARSIAGPDVGRAGGGPPDGVPGNPADPGSAGGADGGGSDGTPGNASDADQRGGGNRTAGGGGPGAGGSGYSLTLG